MAKYHLASPTTLPSATDDDRHAIVPDAPTDLARRAGEALGLLERYRHVEPVAAVCGLRLRPAAERYLEARARQTHPVRSQHTTPAVVRRAQAATHLRTRLDLWSTLLARDVPGFLPTPTRPGLQNPGALLQRARGVMDLVLSHARAGSALPYGGLLVDDLHIAWSALEWASPATSRPGSNGVAPATDLEASLRQELSTFRDVLVTLLGRDHMDAMRAQAIAAQA